jgi:hypothetical protein
MWEEVLGAIIAEDVGATAVVGAIATVGAMLSISDVGGIAIAIAIAIDSYSCGSSSSRRR